MLLDQCHHTARKYQSNRQLRILAMHSLSSLTCQASIVPTTGNSVFYNIPLSKATLYVPETSLEEYKNAEQWQDFGTISPLETAISNVEAPSSVHTQKRITDSQVLIIHNNQIYTITGAVVKID